MTKVTEKTLERKIRKYEWELEYEPNRYGLATVRLIQSGRRMTVQVI